MNRSLGYVNLSLVMWFDLMCGVIRFSPKALPSLHYFVSIVAQFTPTYPNNPKHRKQPPKTKKGEKPQEKLLEKLGAIIKFVLGIILFFIWFVCSDTTTNWTTPLTYYNIQLIMTNNSGNNHFQYKHKNRTANTHK